MLSTNAHKLRLRVTSGNGSLTRLGRVVPVQAPIRPLASHATTTAGRKPILGIRREDPERIWERRCPLSPDAVERLVHEHGLEVLVQPCERRVYRNEEFVKAGAKMHPTLAPADVILGIKETPADEILTDLSPSSKKPRTHIMFSHTHKGQKYNAPLLGKFLASPGAGEAQASGLPTLIDWELLTDERGKRTVGFGWHAGVAGALEGLVSTALLHLNLGVASPFLGTPRPHTAPLASLLASLKRIGEQISTEGTPQSMGPYVVVVTGSGQVSAGALYLLRETLPIQDVAVGSLPRLVKDPTTPLNKIYLLHATQETYLFDKTTGEPATRQAYYADPGNFESRFYDLIAPYTTLLINGVGWSPNSPRLMTVEQTASALVRVRELHQDLQTVEQGLNGETGLKRDVMKGRCQSFADVSCDIEGGLGFLTRPSTLTEPSFSIDLRSAFSGRPFPSAPLPPLQMMSVDILPTSLPLEASERFCQGIVPYVRSVAGRYGAVQGLDPENAKESELDEALERATIASSGKLRMQHEWLQGIVDESRVSASAGQGAGMVPPPKKRILLLGSGMVAGPTVEEICRREDVELVVASDQASRNEFLCQRHPNASPVTIDITQQAKVEELIKGVDVVISLLPVPFHPAVAELCIKHRRDLVTASYISPAMRALHERAAESNVLLLNEIGLDPGIDHCSALALLASLRKEGKKVVSFSSFCGGLPAPECAADVPLRYKFSWSPRGVLSAALNGAQFLVGGKTSSVPSEDLLRSNISQLPVSDVLQLEGLPNRNSLSYSTTYDLHEADGLQTLFRGTIRYPGFCELLLGFKQLGLLDTERSLRITSYSDLIRSSVEDLTGTTINGLGSLKAAIGDLTSSSNDISNVLEAVQWLSQADDMPRPPNVATPVIDLFATLLAHKLAYEQGERDLVVLHHEFVTSNPNSKSGTSRDEVHTSSLEVYGTPEHSAMALCVGVPAALAALRVLDGGYREVGVRGPGHPDMYEFILRGMEERGLRMKHRTRPYVEGQSVEGRLRDIWN